LWTANITVSALFRVVAAGTTSRANADNGGTNGFPSISPDIARAPAPEASTGREPQKATVSLVMGIVSIAVLGGSSPSITTRRPP
jgi:hypothetical protein